MAVLRIQALDTSAFVASVSGQFVMLATRLFIVFIVFRCVFAGSTRALPYSLSEVVVYYFVATFMGYALSEVSTVAYRVWDDIRSGNLVVLLVRPIDYQAFVFARALTMTLLQTTIACCLFAPFGAVFDLGPKNLLSLAQFVLMVILAILVGFTIQFLIGAASFWLEKTLALRDVLASVSALFSGSLIPIGFLPAWLVSFSRRLPFAFLVHLPASAYLGALSPQACRDWLGIGILWLVAGLAACRVLLRMGLRQFKAYGG